MNYRKNNKGSACVEATIVMPIFIMAMISVYCMAKCNMAKLMVYEAVAESAEYGAEYMYIDSVVAAITASFADSYIDDAEITRYIEGGANGISFLGSYVDGDELVVRATYTLKLSLPLLPTLSRRETIELRQKGYVGYKEDEKETEEKAEYVYVTDNQEVYHGSRLCTYLTLSVSGCNKKEAKKEGYEPCSFCGGYDTEYVYITNRGEKYHSDRRCSGLKRTVHRVKKEEVGELGGCSRCVKD